MSNTCECCGAPLEGMEPDSWITLRERLKAVGEARLTPRELHLAALMLKKAADKFSNNVCNDFNLVEDAGMSSQKERKALMVAIGKWSGDREMRESIEESNGSHEYAMDWMVMSYLATRLKEESDV